MNYEDIINQAVKLEDQGTPSASASGIELPPEGKTVCRFIEYVELGTHPRKAYQGTPKKPAPMVRLVFELLNEVNIRKTQNGVITDKVYITLPKILNERSSFYKLFNKLRYGRTNIKHMAQMLGEAFQVTIQHRVSSDKTYVNVTSDDGSYTFEPPLVIIPGKKAPIKLDVPESISGVKVFIWEVPTVESWDSLYIAGEREVNGVKVSKNFIQEKILEAVDFKGSPLETLLNGGASLDSATNKMNSNVTEDLQGLLNL